MYSHNGHVKEGGKKTDLRTTKEWIERDHGLEEARFAEKKNGEKSADWYSEDKGTTL